MRIIEEECVACGQCSEYCPSGAIVPLEKSGAGYATYTIDQDLCVNCGSCKEVDCPGEAIKEQ